MNTRRIAIGAAAIVGAFSLAACGGGAGETAKTPGTPAPAAPVLDAGGGGAEGTFPAGAPVGADQFVGLRLDVATSFAEELGRQWRVGRQDGEDLAVTGDLVPGRVTFAVEGGVVTAATIEAEDEQVVVPPAS